MDGKNLLFKISSFLSLTPLIVPGLIIMDVSYVMISVIVSSLVSIFTAGNNFESHIDDLYTYLFGMTVQEFKGYRRQRTLSQLMF